MSPPPPLPVSNHISTNERRDMTKFVCKDPPEEKLSSFEIINTLKLQAARARLSELSTPASPSPPRELPPSHMPIVIPTEKVSISRPDKSFHTLPWSLQERDEYINPEKPDVYSRAAQSLHTNPNSSVFDSLGDQILSKPPLTEKDLEDLQHSPDYGIDQPDNMTLKELEDLREKLKKKLGDKVDKKLKKDMLSKNTSSKTPTPAVSSLKSLPMPSLKSSSTPKPVPASTPKSVPSSPISKSALASTPKTPNQQSTSSVTNKVSPLKMPTKGAAPPPPIISLSDSPIKVSESQNDKTKGPKLIDLDIGFGSIDKQILNEEKKKDKRDGSHKSHEKKKDGDKEKQKEHKSPKKDKHKHSDSKEGKSSKEKYDKKDKEHKSDKERRKSEECKSHLKKEKERTKSQDSDTDASKNMEVQLSIKEKEKAVPEAEPENKQKVQVEKQEDARKMASDIETKIELSPTKDSLSKKDSPSKIDQNNILPTKIIEPAKEIKLIYERLADKYNPKPKKRDQTEVQKDSQERIVEIPFLESTMSDKPFPNTFKPSYLNESKKTYSPFDNGPRSPWYESPTTPSSSWGAKPLEPPPLFPPNLLLENSSPFLSPNDTLRNINCKQNSYMPTFEPPSSSHQDLVPIQSDLMSTNMGLNSYPYQSSGQVGFGNNQHHHQQPYHQTQPRLGNTVVNTFIIHQNHTNNVNHNPYSSHFSNSSQQFGQRNKSFHPFDPISESSDSVSPPIIQNDYDLSRMQSVDFYQNSSTNTRPALLPTPQFALPIEATYTQKESIPPVRYSRGDWQNQSNLRTIADPRLKKDDRINCLRDPRERDRDLNRLPPRDDLNRLPPRDDLNRLPPRDDLNRLPQRDGPRDRSFRGSRYDERSLERKNLQFEHKNKYDEVYSKLDKSKSNNESFASPLDSLYSSGEKKATGRGYGVQHYKIPKKKISDEITRRDRHEDISNRHKEEERSLFGKKVEDREETNKKRQNDIEVKDEAPAIEESENVPERKVDNLEENSKKINDSDKKICGSEPAKIDQPANNAESNKDKVAESVDKIISGSSDKNEQSMLTDFIANLIGGSKKKDLLVALFNTIADGLEEQQKNKFKKIVDSESSDEENDNENKTKKEDNLKESISKEISEVKEDKCEVIETKETEKDDEKIATDESKQEEKSDIVVVSDETNSGKSIKGGKKKPGPKRSKASSSSTKQLKSSDTKKESDEGDDNDGVYESVGERIKNLRRNVVKPEKKKKKKSRSELDMLHDDIKEMFIRDGVLTATGKRMCRILKDDPEALTKTGPKSEQENKAKSTKKESEELPATPLTRRSNRNQLRVVLEKSDFSKLVPPKPHDGSSSSDENATDLMDGNNIRLRPRRTSVNKTGTYCELDPPPIDDELSPQRKPTRNATKNKLNYKEEPEEEWSSDMAKETKEALDDEEQEEQQQQEKEETAPKTKKKKRRGYNWATGVIKKPGKKKKNLQESVSRSDTPTPSEKTEHSAYSESNEGSGWDEEASDEEFVEPDVNYYFNISEKQNCKLCNFKGKFIVHHYKEQHKNHEIMISRLPPDVTAEAVKESLENNFESITPVHIWENKNRKKKFSFKCKFCHLEFKRENTETFFDHVTLHTGEYRFCCDYCPFFTGTAKVLRSHLNTAHSFTAEDYGAITPAYPPPPNFNMIFGYVCGECNYLQLNRNAVEEHIKIYHLGNDKNIYKINMSMEVFNKNSLLNDVNDEKEIEETSTPEQQTTEKDNENETEESPLEVKKIRNKPGVKKKKNMSLTKDSRDSPKSELRESTLEKNLTIEAKESNGKTKGSKVEEQEIETGTNTESKIDAENKDIKLATKEKLNQETIVNETKEYETDKLVSKTSENANKNEQNTSNVMKETHDIVDVNITPEPKNRKRKFSESEGDTSPNSELSRSKNEVVGNADSELNSPENYEPIQKQRKISKKQRMRKAILRRKATDKLNKDVLIEKEETNKKEDSPESEVSDSKTEVNEESSPHILETNTINSNDNHKSVEVKIIDDKPNAASEIPSKSPQDTVEKSKEKPVDKNIFMCDKEIAEQELRIDEERLRKMEEINQTVSQKRLTLSLTDKLKTLLEKTVETSTDSPNNTEVERKVEDNEKEEVAVKSISRPSSPMKPRQIPLTKSSRTPQNKEKLEKIEKRPFTSLLNKNNTPITSIIQRLQGKLDTEPSQSTSKCKPPPLLRLSDMSPFNDDEEETVQVGPVEGKNDKECMIYGCLVDCCVFKTTLEDVFEEHCKERHPNESWTGFCKVCDKNVVEECDRKGQLGMLDAFSHLVKTHSKQQKEDSVEEEKEEPPRISLRVRRLSGDTLSKSNVEKQSEEEGSKSPNVKMVEDPVFPFKIACVGVDSAEMEEEEHNFPFQISSVTTLTPEEEEELENSTATEVATPSQIVTTPYSQKPIDTQPSTSSPMQAVSLIKNVGTLSGGKLSVFIPVLSPTAQISPQAKTSTSPSPSLIKTKGGNSLFEGKKKITLREIPLSQEELKHKKSEYAQACMLSLHKLKHLYKCPEFNCPFTTNVSKLFVDHMSKHPEIQKLQDIGIPCIYCNFKVTLNQYVLHVDVRHGKCQYGCSLCFYRAICQSYVQIHFEQEHEKTTGFVIKVGIQPTNAKTTPQMPSLKELVPLLECAHCAYKTLFIDEYASHQKTKHQSEPRKCPKCSTGFKFQSYSQHLQVHNLWMFNCRYCATGGSTAAEVYKHLSAKHMANPLDIVVRRFVPDYTGRSPQHYNYDGEEVYSRLERIVTESPKWVNPRILRDLSSDDTSSTKPNNMLFVPPEAVLPDTSVKNQTTTKSTISFALLSNSTTTTASKDGIFLLSTNSPQNMKNLICLSNKLGTKATNNADKDTNRQEGPKEKEQREPNTESNSSTNAELPAGQQVFVPDFDNFGESEDNERSNTDPKELTTEKDPLEISASDLEQPNFIADMMTPNYFSESDSQSYDIDLTFDDIVVDDVAKNQGLMGWQLFKCENCNLGFENSPQFRSHVSKCFENKGETNKPYRCAHCSKCFKSPHALVDHVRLHGTAKYMCSLCDYYCRSRTYVSNHMKSRHKLSSCVVNPIDPKKKDYDKDEFIVRPKINKPPTSSTQRAFPDTNSTQQEKNSANASQDDPTTLSPDSKIMKTVFSPQEIDQLPRQAVYSVEMKCSECPYATKVKTNLVRHLQMHEKEQEVPENAPVNPVPCLDKNEKMFDKMINLAFASNTGAKSSAKADKSGLTKEEEAQLPAFVPITKRFVCGANGCNYLCLEEAMLRHHLLALHADELDYKCKHCEERLSSEKGGINVDIVMKHFKLHDLHLYKCGYCKFVHHLRHKVDRHVSEKHFDKSSHIVIVREMDCEPQTEDSEGARAKFPEEIKETKPWRCGMCKYRCSTRNEMVAHAYNKHDISSQYKCALCSYKTASKDSFDEHFSARHPGQAVDIIDAFYKLDEVQAAKNTPVSTANNEPFDTTPLWQRDRPRIRHIRGILFDESGKIPKKSPFKIVTAQASTSPSSSSINLDKAIEAVAKGTSTLIGKTDMSDNSSNTNIIKEPNVVVDVTTTPPSKKLKKKLPETITKFEADEIIEIKDDSDEDLPTSVKTSVKDQSKGAEDGSEIRQYKNLKKKVVDKNSSDDNDIVTEVNTIKQPNSSTASPRLKSSELIQEFEETMLKSALEDQADKPTTISTNNATLQEITEMDMEKLMTTDLMGTYGPYGKPFNKQFLCPLCAKFKTKNPKDITHHLYKELDYSRYICTQCGRKAITYEFLERHVGSVHKTENPTLIIRSLSPDPQIESWVQTVLLVQRRITCFTTAKQQASKQVDVNDHFQETDSGSDSNSFPVSVTPDSKETGGSILTATTSISPQNSLENGNSSQSTSKEIVPSTQKLQQCFYCNYKCKAAGDLRKHEKRHWAQKPLRCGYCYFEGVTNYEIHSHQKRTHAGKDLLVIAVPTPSSPVILPIVRKRKSQAALEEISKKRLAVEFTPEAMPSVLEETSKINLAEVVNVTEIANNKEETVVKEDYQCYHCPKRTTSIEAIKVHWENTHKAKMKTFGYKMYQPKKRIDVRCDYCNEGGCISYLRKHHMDVHPKLPIRLYRRKCAKCNQLFLKLDEFKKHKLECSVENPGSTSNLIVDLEAEDSLLVPSSKEFLCTTCYSYFPIQSQLQQHIITVHQKKELQHAKHENSTYNEESASKVIVLSSSSSSESDMDVMTVPKKVTARKSTSKLHSPQKITARKSTSRPPVVSSEGYSFYGCKADRVDLDKITTTVPFMGSTVETNIEKLSQIVNLFPQVLVVDCEHSGNAGGV